MFYCGVYAGEEHLYVAYNFQNEPQKMALPREISWEIIFGTGREESEKKIVTGEVVAEANTILLLRGREKSRKERIEKNGKKRNRN